MSFRVYLKDITAPEDIILLFNVDSAVGYFVFLLLFNGVFFVFDYRLFCRPKRQNVLSFEKCLKC